MKAKAPIALLPRPLSTTLVKLAGGSLEQKNALDGKDVWPMLTQGAPSPHDAILCVQSPKVAAVRMGDWKLVMNGSDADSEEAPAGAAKAKGKGKKGKAKEATATPKDNVVSLDSFRKKD